ncbi:MAG TPA: MFS transporter [Longimicrobiaceae bacterium]|nr:MFS transporter [Longimicrobiaceae bacterium]
MGAGEGGRLRFMLRALSHRNYRLFFFGQGTSVVGTWITRVATSWLVYRLTGSAAILGLVGFAGQVPTFVLGPFAGVWVDRLDRYRVLLTAQVLAMLQSAALAVLTLTGVIQIWHILVLALFQGVVNAFDTPSRQAFVVEMVEGPADLPNAIALNSSLVNGARLLGPSIAGVLVALVGEGWCFLVDSISYLAVIGSLLAMHRVRRARPARETKVLNELKAGFRYAFGFAPVRAVLLLLALVSLTGGPYVVLMPIMAADVLHGGANTLGVLLSATGVGALAGALYLASRRSVVGLGRLVPWAAAAFGVGLCAFALSRSLVLSLVLLAMVGAGFMVQTASTNTILQTLVSEEMRGRVMSFYAVAILGTAPFGSLLAGGIAAHVGAPWAIFGGGVICVVGAAAFARFLPRLSAEVRPIYEERGILPAIAAGLGDATSIRHEAAE